MARCCLHGLVLGVLISATAGAAEEDAARPYRFVVDSQGDIRGLITVDGKTRLVPVVPTPFEFECERASVISGYFEPVAAGHSLELKVFDPEYKRGRRASLRSHGASPLRFAWGQPGAAPRCADLGTDEITACPPTVPTAEELKRQLEELVAGSGGQ